VTHAVVRCRRDAELVLGGAFVFVVCALGVEEHSVSGLERWFFEAVNGAPSLVPFVVVWPFMQLGNFLVVPVVALVALVMRRLRLAAAVVLAGAVTYVVAKLIKRVVERGRPAAVLDDVTIRGTAAHGLGFVSGHAAVVVALTTVAWPYLGTRGRRLAAAGAVIVCVARVYVGAHLPLDVLAGAAVGIAVGGLVNLVVGRPAPCP
jgi:membrane-associated phospholipid phosphatase